MLHRPHVLIECANSNHIDEIWDIGTYTNMIPEESEVPPKPIVGLFLSIISLIPSHPCHVNATHLKIRDGTGGWTLLDTDVQMS